MSRKKVNAFLLGSVLLVAAQLFPLNIWAENRVEKPVEDSIDIRQSTQQQRDKWREERERLLAQLEELEDQNAKLQKEHDVLEQTLGDEQKRRTEKKEQLADIKEISNQIQPFLDELLHTIDIRVSQGLPFLPEERKDRMQDLQEMNADPEVSTSEKYRKIMEALLIEAEYGFTTEVYQEEIPVQGETILVNVFRLGRLNLFYLSLDRESCGFYNIAEKSWQPLSPVYLRDIRAAVEIATKRRTAELLTLPLGRIVR
ncbi:MAG: DUF3450 domain-containing protein [Desulfovermiculus sp.]